jgi:hypothetical protein
MVEGRGGEEVVLEVGKNVLAGITIRSTKGKVDHRAEESLAFGMPMVAPSTRARGGEEGAVFVGEDLIGKVKIKKRAKPKRVLDICSVRCCRVVGGVV